MEDHREVLVLSAARTAIGKYGGGLAAVPPCDLAATVVREAVGRAGVDPSDVGHAVFGHVIHTEIRDMYLGRVAAVSGGLPVETPAFTLNRLCGSGLQAIVSAAQAIRLGDCDVAVAGGAESMSRGQYWLPGMRWGQRMQDGVAIDAMVGHPVRIRVLELLRDGPKPVRDLLAEPGIEPSGLSQQLAVLRRSGIVTATRHGTTVVYALAGGDVAELMRAARRILTEMLTGRDQLLAELPNRLPSRADPGPHNRQPTPGAPPVPRPAGWPAGTFAGQLGQRCTPCMRYTARTGADHDHQAATRPQSRLRRKLADHGSRIGLMRITESGVRGTAGGPVLYRAVWAWRLARLGGRFD